MDAHSRSDAHSRLPALVATFVATLASALVLAPAGAASTAVVERDTRGRAITFDVRAPGAHTRGYADILSGAAHGDEISTARFVVATESEVDALCGEGAEACYRWTMRNGKLREGRVIVPPWPAPRLRQVLLHEYAHHIDASSRVQPGAKVFDGTPRWFAKRDMGARIATGEVDWLYDKGWSRAIGEIFAEDYVVLHDIAGRHRVDWLGRPSQAVLQALAADLGTVAPVLTTRRPSIRARALRRAGALPRGRARTLRLPRAGAARRLTLSGRLRGARRARAVIQLRCRGRTIATLRAGRGRLTLRRKLPSGACRVRIRARKAAVRYQLKIVLR